MSARETAFKIRDTQTGLFWGGHIKGVTCPIGTRFHSFDALKDSLRVYMDKHGPVPDHWEIIEVKIIEEPFRVVDPHEMAYSIRKHELLPFYSTYRDALIKVLAMETQWEFLIPFKRNIASEHDLWNRPKVIREFMQSKELETSRFVPLPTIAAVACDELTGTMMQLHGLAEVVINIPEEVAAFVRRTGIPESYIK